MTDSGCDNDDDDDVSVAVYSLHVKAVTVLTGIVYDTIYAVWMRANTLPYLLIHSLNRWSESNAFFWVENKYEQNLLCIWKEKLSACRPDIYECISKQIANEFHLAALSSALMFSMQFQRVFNCISFAAFLSHAHAHAHAIW